MAAPQLPPPPTHHSSAAGESFFEAVVAISLVPLLAIALTAAIFGVLYLLWKLITRGKADQYTGCLFPLAMIGTGAVFYSEWDRIWAMVRWTSVGIFNVMLVVTILLGLLFILFAVAVFARRYWRTIVSAALFITAAVVLRVYFDWGSRWSIGAGALLGALALFSLCRLLPGREDHWNA